MNSNKMLLEKVNSEYKQCRIPGIVLTHSGTLLAYYECRKEFSDWADIDLKIIRSTDGGETWDVVEIIPSEGNTLNNPMMAAFDNEVLLLYCKNYRQLLIRRSQDDGITFSEPIEISEVFEKNLPFYNVVAIGPGHGVIHNGNILIPIWFAQNKEDIKAHSPSNIAVMYSKDRGTTWEIGDLIGQDVLMNPSECALAVIDKKVLISIRNENAIKRRAIAISDTGYDKWSEVRFVENLIDPICQGSVDSRGDKLFLINCEYETERKNLCIKVSNDIFATFEKIFVDEEGGYSDIAVSKDAIYIIYERDVANDGLYFAKIEQ